jgi:tol-pal system protein YbgF
MRTFIRTACATTVVALCALAPVLAPLPAHAALFEDDDARREIIKLRKQLDDINTRIDGRIAGSLESLNARIDSKSDKTSSLDLTGEIDKLRNEIANLRGQVEVLNNDLANAQRREKDFYTDLDQRLRKLEPQRLSVDGKEVDVDQTEQKNFEAALALFKAGSYQAADEAFSSFLQHYPESSYVAQANYWLGNTYYAVRDCAKAIPAYRAVATRFPSSQKAPDALLNMASCQLELKDKIGARESLESLLKKYPGSTAAGMGKERLAELK